MNWNHIVKLSLFSTFQNSNVFSYPCLGIFQDLKLNYRIQDCFFAFQKRDSTLQNRVSLFQVSFLYSENRNWIIELISNSKTAFSILNLSQFNSKTYLLYFKIVFLDFISYCVRDHAFMTSLRKGEGVGGLEIRHMLQILLFLNNRSVKWMTPNCLLNLEIALLHFQIRVLYSKTALLETDNWIMAPI